MLLPPQIFMVFRPHCREHVIGVHDNVHGIVDEIAESSVATGYELDAYPSFKWCQRMMIEVQKRHLAVFLPQHKE